MTVLPPKTAPFCFSGAFGKDRHSVTRREKNGTVGFVWHVVAWVLFRADFSLICQFRNLRSDGFRRLAGHLNSLPKAEFSDRIMDVELATIPKHSTCER